LIVLPEHWSITNSHNGMLMAFGEFLGQHGLLAHLNEAPIGQKVRKHSPQAKHIEFQAGIMGAIEAELSRFLLDCCLSELVRQDMLMRRRG
jgi:hypothetical protein